MNTFAVILPVVNETGIVKDRYRVLASSRNQWVDQTFVFNSENDAKEFIRDSGFVLKVI